MSTSLVNGGNLLVNRWKEDPQYSPDKKGSSLTKEAKTFVVIDFGTSTTVVSAIVKNSGEGYSWKPEALQISQPRPGGGSVDSYIVDSVLAGMGDKLYFGQPAVSIRRKHPKKAGKSVFSSFKMDLGIDVGPNYPYTAYSNGNGTSIIIQTAEDAAREFFKLLVPQIQKAVRELNLPPRIEYVVSVPASFQANQRRDLKKALSEAGINVSEGSFIDEPNAAFLSYLFEDYSSQEADLNESLSEGKSLNILVYDFGAGTCDVSVLTISAGDRDGKKELHSKNRGISHFTALGGDDIDIAIVNKVLLKQLLGSEGKLNLKKRFIDGTLVPFLKPTAERLKIAINEWLEREKIERLEDLEGVEKEFFENRTEEIKIKGKPYCIEKPKISLTEFSEVMADFIGEEDGDSTSSDCKLFGPVEDALSKSGLDDSDLYGVLFIGGSSESPIVRQAIMDKMPMGVKALIPRDMRIHVSQGAAIHSASYHGFSYDIIVPITSEPISIVTKGDNLQTLIRASTQVPSRVFETQLKVSRNMQTVVELPICLGATNKLLGILQLKSGAVGFTKDSIITVRGMISHAKLLRIKADCEGKTVEASLKNPLSYEAINQKEDEYLRALREFNTALCKGKQFVTESILRRLINACTKTGRYEETVDYLRGLEENFDKDEATGIAYYYSQAGRREEAHEWFRKAYERRKDELTAYNLSCQFSGPEHERYLRESLSHDPNYVTSLFALGNLLFSQGKEEGTTLLSRLIEVSSRKIKNSTLSERDARELIETARKLKRSDVDEIASEYLQQLKAREKVELYDSENLASTLHGSELVRN